VRCIEPAGDLDEHGANGYPNHPPSSHLETTMTAPHRYLSALVLCLPAFLWHPRPLAAQTPPAVVPAAATALPPDGQHDFDFNLGAWKTQVSRLQHPLTGSSTWVHYEGTHIVRKVWNGRANLGELEVDGPAGHIEGLALRLYNPHSHQWNVYFANSGNGTMDGMPLVGSFQGGRGYFVDQEDFNGRNILVRNVWSDITPTSCRSEQAFSADGGRTWEVNWIAVDTRLPDDAQPARGPAQPQPPAPQGLQAGVATPRDGQHDFDFDMGSWKIHMRRLRHPLTGSSEWFEMDGTTVTQPIWGGRANIAEVEGDAPGEPHLEILALRLYNPRSHQWSIRFASSGSGTLNDIPTVGVFQNGQGEFLDSEPYTEDRSIFIRFDIGPRDARSAHSEQAFSGDGGKTWETNWINDYVRVN
jgi:hypothetical protein